MQITKTADFKEKTKAVVMFTMTTCGPCKLMTPVMEKLEKEYPNMYFVKVVADETPEIAAAYSIRSVPTILGMVDGEVKSTLMGYTSEEALREVLDILNS